MALTLIGGDCQRGRDCSNAYVTERRTVAIQGDVITQELDRDIPGHEAVVEIPQRIFDDVLEAIRVARG